MFRGCEKRVTNTHLFDGNIGNVLECLSCTCFALHNIAEYVCSIAHLNLLSAWKWN